MESNILSVITINTGDVITTSTETHRLAEQYIDWTTDFNPPSRNKCKCFSRTKVNKKESKILIFNFCSWFLCVKHLICNVRFLCRQKSRLHCPEFKWTVSSSLFRASFNYKRLLFIIVTVLRSVWCYFIAVKWLNLLRAAATHVQRQTNIIRNIFIVIIFVGIVFVREIAVNYCWPKCVTAC